MNSQAYRKLFDKKLLTGLFVWFIVFMAITAVKPGHASAISNVAPEVGSSNAITGAGAQPWFAVGKGQYNGHTSYAKVYIPRGQTAIISVDQGGGVCPARDVGQPSVDYELDQFDSNENLAMPGFQVLKSGGTGQPCGDIKFNSIGCPAQPTYEYPINTIYGHQGYCVFGVYAVISDKTPPSGDHEKSFRVSTSSGWVGISRPWRQGVGPFGIYRRDIGPAVGASVTWDYNVEIAQRCVKDPFTTTQTVTIFDADSGVYSPQNLAFRIQSAQRGTANWVDNPPGASWSGAQLGGDGSTVPLYYSSTHALKYLYKFSGFNWRNTIQITAPFDQFDASLADDYCKGIQPQPVATCNYASAGRNPANIKEASPFTVNVSNNGGSALNSSYSLRQTYWSSFDTRRVGLSRSLTGGNVAGVSYTGPGYLDPPPGQNSGNFLFNVSRVAPGTYYFDFQMQQNGNFVGNNCHLELTVSPPLRPACNYLDGTDFPLPPGGGQVTFRVGILNSSGQNWTNRYFMIEDVNGGGYKTNIHYLGDPNASPNAVAVGPGAYTDSISRTFNVTSTGITNFNYQVWVQPPPPIYATYKDFRLANPESTNNLPPGPGTTGIIGQAPGSATCTITVTVADPPTYSSAGSFLEASCTAIRGNIWYQGTGGAPRGLLRIIRNSDGASMGDVGVGAWDGSGSYPYFNKDPFKSWRLAPHDTYTVQLHGQNSAGDWDPMLKSTPLNGGNPCLRVQSCNIATDTAPEPGQATIATISVTTVNSTSVPFDPSYGYSVGFNSTGSSVSPPSGNQPVSIGIGGSNTSPLIVLNIVANSRIDINAGIRYLGAAFTGFGDCSELIIPATLPYFKSFQGDIKAAGVFKNVDGSCNIGAAKYGAILGYARPTTTNGGRRGASTDFGAYALGLIHGNNTNGPYGFYDSGINGAKYQNLSFANSGTIPDLGGGWMAGKATAIPPPSIGTNHCVTNYFDGASKKLKPTYTPQSSVTASNLAPDTINNVPGQYFYSPSGSSYVTISGGTISGKTTIFVNGNVYINSNITYGLWNPMDTANAPYLTIIAKGNITVAPGVTRLDGLYVAQPTAAQPTTTGIFATCASPLNPAQPANATEISANCRQQLVVNGAVIAQQAMLLRSNGTLLLAPGDNAETSTSPNPAEIFNYMPSMILIQPNLQAEGSGDITPGLLQGVFSLPPVF